MASNKLFKESTMAPTPEQVEAKMIEQMGALPPLLASAKKVDPRFLVEQMMSNKHSFKDELNPFDPKTSRLIGLAVALTAGNEGCISMQAKMLKEMGTTNTEMAYLVKLIKHVQGSITMHDAQAAFDVFGES